MARQLQLERLEQRCRMNAMLMQQQGGPAVPGGSPSALGEPVGAFPTRPQRTSPPSQGQVFPPNGGVPYQADGAEWDGGMAGPVSWQPSVDSGQGYNPTARAPKSFPYQGGPPSGAFPGSFPQQQRQGARPNGGHSVNAPRYPQVQTHGISHNNYYQQNNLNRPARQHAQAGYYEQGQPYHPNVRVQQGVPGVQNDPVDEKPVPYSIWAIWEPPAPGDPDLSVSDLPTERQVAFHHDTQIIPHMSPEPALPLGPSV